MAHVQISILFTDCRTSQFSCNCAFVDKEELCKKVGFITTFLHSINATRESNKNGRFSARLRLVNLMLGREIKNVAFLGITEIFEDRKHVAFLLLLRPTYMQK